MFSKKGSKCLKLNCAMLSPSLYVPSYKTVQLQEEMEFQDKPSVASVLHNNSFVSSSFTSFVPIFQKAKITILVLCTFFCAKRAHTVR